jgi:ABC-2 type transport system permease protein
MVRLIGVELTRLRWRRAVKILLIACLAVPVIVFVVTAWTTRPVSEADLERAQEMVEHERAQPYFQRDLARCENRPQRWGAQDASQCEEMMAPQVDWFLDRPQLDIAEVHRNQGLAVIIFLSGLLMLSATTFVGADWNSGSMSNQLLFEPRRIQIWLAKALAVMATAAVAMGLVLAAFWAGMSLLAGSRDIQTAAAVVDRIQGSSVRAVIFVAAAALGAYAVTMLFRSTVFTLGALFAVVVVSSIVLAALGLSERWMPHTNVAAVIFDGATYYREPPEVCYMGERPPAGVDCREMGRVMLGDAALYLGSFLSVAVAFSLASFRRRDVP